MLINYAGPASFRRYSLVDVLGDRVPREALKDKIVLVGAVSPSMGDSRISPFIAYSENEGMAGQEMPGVEVHANIINTIRQRLGLSLLAIEADAQLLAQAINNLLSNAIKYSPADSEVSIEAESDADYIRIVCRITARGFRWRNAS
ncbi:MAG TPA: CHASE2 domain-containing protein [Pyrinomonadaceae bacterium]|nr:CHASE2 domain-containing protein [Pyrinomonadaceae bacterium]